MLYNIEYNVENSFDKMYYVKESSYISGLCHWSKGLVVKSRKNVTAFYSKTVHLRKKTQQHFLSLNCRQMSKTRNYFSYQWHDIHFSSYNYDNAIHHEIHMTIERIIYKKWVWKMTLGSINVCKQTVSFCKWKAALLPLQTF